MPHCYIVHLHSVTRTLSKAQRGAQLNVIRCKTRRRGGRLARASKNRCCFDSTSFAHSCPQDWWPTLWSQVVAKLWPSCDQVVTKMWPSCDLIEPNCDPSNLSNIQKLVWTTHQFTWLKRACYILRPAVFLFCMCSCFRFVLKAGSLGRLGTTDSLGPQWPVCPPQADTRTLIVLSTSHSATSAPSSSATSV